MWDHLAEIEWMEHYYGLDRGNDAGREYRATETCGLDDDDDDAIEYGGYGHSDTDFADTDWPIAEYHQPADWSDIPF